MPGCIGFRVFPSPEVVTDITVLHEWVDQAAFDAYLRSEAFARSGEVLPPMMIAPPSSRRYRVELIETAERPSRAQMPSGRSAEVRRALTITSAQPGDQPRFDDIADQIGLAPRSLARRFDRPCPRSNLLSVT